jgi:hypothetical protein
MEEQKHIRRRVNVSKSVNGVRTYDVTVEIVEDFPGYEDNVRILTESDNLVAELEKRYPTIEEVKEK